MNSQMLNAFASEEAWFSPILPIPEGIGTRTETPNTLTERSVGVTSLTHVTEITRVREVTERTARIRISHPRSSRSHRQFRSALHKHRHAAQHQHHSPCSSVPKIGQALQRSTPLTHGTGRRDHPIRQSDPQHRIDLCSQYHSYLISHQHLHQPYRIRHPLIPF